MTELRSRAQSVPAGVAIGVDTGGTHTDLVLAAPGRLLTLKVPSTPHDLSDGILDGTKKIVALAGLQMSDVERFVYASTLVTNLIVEESEAQVGLITTQGFRDILEIRRASRKPDVYDIHWRPAKPLVPRHLRLTVPERMDHMGQVITPLDEEAARATLGELTSLGVRSIAVCLLHAYANPAHERRIAQIAAEVCPHIDLSISSDVVREFREYERTSTTCVSAFIRRPITEHLDCLAQALAAAGVSGAPSVMRSNGGISTFDAAARRPAALAHSGPMGGIVGATALAASCGIADLITLDMGGTSADVSLVAGGTPVLTHRSQIGAHPLLVPTLDLVTIGAGGGSIAWLDGSALRVGPRSAGAVPGPACYGQGGVAPTITDANLHCGRLNPDYFLAGARRLQPALARQALDERIAAPLGLSVDAAALGLIAIAEAHMVNAIRLVSVERGLDPRDFTLIAFGGAGALHALHLAEALGIHQVLIPPAPGNLSAMGLLCADVRHDLTRTLVAPVTPALAGRMSEVFDELLAQAQEALAHDRVEPGSQRCLLSADLRYQGQNYELNLPMTDIDANGLERLVQGFHALHQRVYGYHLGKQPVQLVSLRVTALGAMPHAQWPSQAPRQEAAPLGTTRRLLLASGEWIEAPIYRFADLAPGGRIAGTAVIEHPGSTFFVAPGWQACFDERMSAHVSRQPADDRYPQDSAQDNAQVAGELA